MIAARHLPARLLAVAAVLVLAAVAMIAPSAATADQQWADADEAAIHPGVQTVTAGAQCTANFIFVGGDSVFIGQSAHCSGTDGSTATDGCDAGTLPTGTEVTIGGATEPGVMVYNSWETMQAVGETDTNACAYNDFALVEIDPADHHRVNPTIPFWGGPEGVTSTTSFGESVYSYGNSSLRLGVEVLSPKEGTSLGQSGDGWTHAVYTATPGVPGDSGSAFIAADGSAFGVLSTLQLLPLAGSNGVTDLSRALEYMREHADGFADVEVVDGTGAFGGGLLP